MKPIKNGQDNLVLFILGISWYVISGNPLLEGPMLVFNLKKEWFEKIKSGEKTTEYRLYKDFWIKRVDNALLKDHGLDFYNYLINNHNLILDIPCKFVLGYTKNCLFGKVKEIDVINICDSDLRGENTNIDKVIALHFNLDKE